MSDHNDPDNWRAPKVPLGCDKPTDMYPSDWLRLQRDTACRMYNELLAAVREYFEAGDLFESAVNGRIHDEATEWCDRKHEREAALRRLVGMEVRDET